MGGRSLGVSKKRPAAREKKASSAKRHRRATSRPAQPAAARFAHALADPDVPIDEAARALLEFHEGHACRVFLASIIAGESSPQRVSELAAAALRMAPDAPSALATDARGPWGRQSYPGRPRSR